MADQGKPRMKNGVIRRGSRWAYVVREPDAETGKSKPRWVGGFATEKEAKAARDKARAATHDGTYVAPRNVTVGEWLTLWLDAHKATLKPSTAASYSAKIEAYLRPSLGKVKLQALSPSRLSKLWADLADHGGVNGKPLSPRTIEYARAILRKACADAIVERLISINPVHGSKAPRRQRRELRVWDDKQQAAFLAATKVKRWGIVWRVALATGMRRGELCGLAWDAFDRKAATLTVSMSSTQVGQEVVTTDTKSSGVRVVALDPATVTALKAWRKKQSVERLKAGEVWEDTGLIFTWEDGSRVLPDYLSKLFIKAQEGLDLPRLTLHGTRHSHACTLLRAGVPVHVVAARLGHADPSVTLRVYSHAIPADGTAAAAVFATAVGNV